MATPSKVVPMTFISMGDPHRRVRETGSVDTSVDAAGLGACAPVSAGAAVTFL
jgi:hypothetical protein